MPHTAFPAGSGYGTLWCCFHFQAYPRPTPMSGRKIYSAELKLEIVERYLKGDIGIKKLAQEYHVSYGDIQKWRDAYQGHGVEGLSTTRRTYTGEFKASDSAAFLPVPVMLSVYISALIP